MRATQLAIVFLTLMSCQLSAQSRITLWDKNWTPEGLAIVELLLTRTEAEFGEFELVKSVALEQARAQRELIAGRSLDLIMFATNLERENKLQAIYTPLTKGLASYRVCIINKNNASLFSKINSIDDWQQKRLFIGQGQHWPDVSILRRNKINVVTASRLDSLYSMLKRDRFECYARAVFEAQNELAKLDDSRLQLYPDLVFYYPMPSYIFINKQNKALQKRLESGFAQILKSGDFSQFIQSHYQNAYQFVNQFNKKRITLNNPQITEATNKVIQSPTLFIQPTLKD